MKLQEAQYENWLNMDFWQIWEAIFLLLGFEPDNKLLLERYRYGGGSAEFWKEFDKLNRLIQDGIDSNNLTVRRPFFNSLYFKAIPLDLLSWTKKKQIKISEELSRLLDKENISNHSKESEKHEKNIFFKNGDTWTVRFEGIEKNIKHSKGMLYIEFFLKNPNKTFTISEVKHIVEPPPPEIINSISVGSEALERAGLFSDNICAQEKIDKKARQQVTERLNEIKELLEECNDDEKREELEEETEKCKTYLKEVNGKNGKSRVYETDDRLAYDRIKKAVDRAINNIVTKIPALEPHFNDCLKMSTSSSQYKSQFDISW